MNKKAVYIILCTTIFCIGAYSFYNTIETSKQKTIEKLLKEVEGSVLLSSKLDKKDIISEYIFTQELNQRREKQFKDHQLLLYICFLFLIVSIIFGYNYFKQSSKFKKSIHEIQELNIKLQSFVLQNEQANNTLKNKNKEIEKLLNLNERMLFSKTLKISTYCDTITKISHNLSKIIAQNEQINVNRLFGIEKSLKTMINEEETWKAFSVQFENTNPHFFKDLKQICPQLSKNDLKHCAYILANLRNKDVANLINVSPRSVETTRYRIKKKFGLKKEESLFNFLHDKECKLNSA